MKNITMKRWGKDHWSLLAYVETRCVDHKGRLDTKHIRMNGVEYATKLKGGETVPDHGDFECLDDMEEEGLLINVGTGINPCCHLTGSGWRVAHELRRHKAAGGNFADFVPLELVGG